MHLLTFVKLRNPGILFRSTVLVAQGVLYNVRFARASLHKPHLFSNHN